MHESSRGGGLATILVFHGPLRACLRRCLFSNEASCDARVALQTASGPPSPVLLVAAVPKPSARTFRLDVLANECSSALAAEVSYTEMGTWGGRLTHHAVASTHWLHTRAEYVWQFCRAGVRHHRSSSSRRECPGPTPGWRSVAEMETLFSHLATEILCLSAAGGDSC
jgi:hypothetical protein